jgi:hypothetical protein
VTRSPASRPARRRSTPKAGADGYLSLLAAIDPHMLADAVLLPPSYDAAWRETEGYLRGHDPHGAARREPRGDRLHSGDPSGDRRIAPLARA